MAAAMGHPIGSGLYNEVITEYPEYFPKEAEHRRRWNAIPQNVHDAYHKESNDFYYNLWKDEPKGPGIIGLLNNTEEYLKWNEAYKRLRLIEQAKEKELHAKYYAQYGI